MIDVRPPRSAAELEACYRLRHAVLRAPWSQPMGSERDELEQQAFHLMAIDTSGEVLAVGRLHGVDPQTAQIRYMAVREDQRGSGLGLRVLTGLEREAARLGFQTIVLNARESVAAFYQRHGYEDVGPGPLLFGSIPHRRFSKQLA